MHGKCRVVGIAGGSASGKTTLTRALTHYLESLPSPYRVETLNADVFYHSDKTKGPFFVSSSSGESLFNFNHPDAVDREGLLSTIRARTTAEDMPQILLIEGLMILHFPEVRGLCDVRLFVELEADVRALRRLLRDMKGGRASTDPEWIATYYLECARVGHEQFVEPSRAFSDFTVRGDADFTRLVPLLTATMTSELTRQEL